MPDGFVLTLCGDRGALMFGQTESVTFGDWRLTPQGNGRSDLRVSQEIRHAYYGRKPATALRIRFRGRTGSAADTGPIRGTKTAPAAVKGDEETWWIWRTFRVVAPGHYQVEGLPDEVR